MGKRFVLAAVTVLAASLLPASRLVAQATCGGTLGPCTTIPSNNTAYGTTAAEFLLLAPSARGQALGGSFAALTTDVSSVYFNPAGLAQGERAGAMASSMNYVASTKYSWAAVAVPFGGGSKAFGVSVANFGFSDQRVYTVDDPTGTSGEVYSVSETAVGLTYSQQFSDRFSMGITGKYINDALGRVSGSAFALDFGTSFHALVGGRPIRASFVVQNLGTTLGHKGQVLDVSVQRPPPTGEQPITGQEAATTSLRTKDWPLPVMFRVGLAYDVFQMSAGRLSIMGEFTQPNNNEPGYNFGGEYAVSLGSTGFSVAGRASVTYWPDNNLAVPDSGRAGFVGSSSSSTQYRMAAGGGLRYQPGNTGFGIGIDYAYRNMGLLGGVNMVTVGFTW
jgi:hypothetical protein